MNKDNMKHETLFRLWNFIPTEKHKAAIQILKEDCESLNQFMQKTAGQRKDQPSDISFSYLDTISDLIVLETMSLYLSGDLDKLEKEVE